MNPALDKLLEPQSLAWLTFGLVTLTASLVLRWWLFRSPVRVLAHRAYMEVKTSDEPDAKTDTRTFWFVKIRNVSRHDVSVSHVGYTGGGKYVSLLARKLPVRIPPGATWETYIEASAIANLITDTVDPRGFLVHHGAELTHSRLNRHVAPIGYVESPV